MLEKIRQELRERPFFHGIPYWTGAALVGIVAVIYSGAFSGCIFLVRTFYSSYPEWLFLTSPICFFLATWLVEKVAPAAGGTGIPQVIKALQVDSASNPNDVEYYLSLKVCLVVIFSSLLGVLGAGSLGREGPVVQIAACLFYYVGKRFSTIWPSNEHRSWILAGGAAGVAAAFNAPLAGVVFVLEELAQQHFHQFKSVVISAAIIGGVVSQWLSGKYLYFGYPKIGVVLLSSIPWALLVGVVCGVLAYPFHKLLKINWRNKVPRYFQTRLMFAVLMGFVMAALANFVSPRSIGGGVAVVEDLLLEGERADFSLFFARFFGTIASHLSGCAGGFLAPALALGATIGSLFSTAIDYPNHNLMVLVGMAAFLSAIVRAPFTAWVVVMEMTDRHQAIFPLMIASLVSHGTLSFISGPKRIREKRK
ncbi:MAG: chloride channel protein [Proteobacteria bacterium]|nr:chloride channel protein [Pseudomonadota bacterium]